MNIMEELLELYADGKLPVKPADTPREQDKEIVRLEEEYKMSTKQQNDFESFFYTCNSFYDEHGFRCGFSFAVRLLMEALNEK